MMVGERNILILMVRKGKAVKDTINYYNEHAVGFTNSTKDVEFTNVQDKFLGYLKDGVRVLDFGCGSGRDTKYFLSKGFNTDASDGSAELVKIASDYTGTEVKQQLFQDLDAVGLYDGIWACSSILHLSYEELILVFEKIAEALVSRGIFYTSFKYGVEETVRNGRFFMDMTEDKFNAFLEKVGLFSIEEMWKTSDVRPGRDDEKWLNLILRKKL